MVPRVETPPGIYLGIPPDIHIESLPKNSSEIHSDIRSEIPPATPGEIK